MTFIKILIRLVNSKQNWTKLGLQIKFKIKPINILAHLLTIHKPQCTKFNLNFGHKRHKNTQQVLFLNNYESSNSMDLIKIVTKLAYQPVFETKNCEWEALRDLS